MRRDEFFHDSQLICSIDYPVAESPIIRIYENGVEVLAREALPGELLPEELLPAPEEQSNLE